MPLSADQRRTVASDVVMSIWQLDRDTGAENRAIDRRFTGGDRVRVRLVDSMHSDRPGYPAAHHQKEHQR
jgi:hypothetical protein